MKYLRILCLKDSMRRFFDAQTQQQYMGEDAAFIYYSCNFRRGMPFTEHSTVFSSDMLLYGRSERSPASDLCVAHDKRNMQLHAARKIQAAQRFAGRQPVRRTDICGHSRILSDIIRKHAGHIEASDTADMRCSRRSYGS